MRTHTVYRPGRELPSYQPTSVFVRSSHQPVSRASALHSRAGTSRERIDAITTRRRRDTPRVTDASPLRAFVLSTRKRTRIAPRAGSPTRVTAALYVPHHRLPDKTPTQILVPRLRTKGTYPALAHTRIPHTSEAITSACTICVPSSITARRVSSSSRPSG